MLQLGVRRRDEFQLDEEAVFVVFVMADALEKVCNQTQELATPNLHDSSKKITHEDDASDDTIEDAYDGLLRTVTRPWKAWGPDITRWISVDARHWFPDEMSAGTRCVISMLNTRQIRMFDFNPYTVRQRAPLQSLERAHDTRMQVVENTTTLSDSIFMEPLESSLPYVCWTLGPGIADDESLDDGLPFMNLDCGTDKRREDSDILGFDFGDILVDEEWLVGLDLVGTLFLRPKLRSHS